MTLHSHQLQQYPNALLTHIVEYVLYRVPPWSSSQECLLQVNEPTCCQLAYQRGSIDYLLFTGHCEWQLSHSHEKCGSWTNIEYGIIIYWCLVWAQSSLHDLAGKCVTFDRQSHKSSDLVFQNYYAKKTIEKTNTKYVVTIRWCHNILNCKLKKFTAVLILANNVRCTMIYFKNCSASLPLIYKFNIVSFSKSYQLINCLFFLCPAKAGLP